MSKRVLPQQALGEDGGPASKVAKEDGPPSRSTKAAAKPPVIGYRDSEPLHILPHWRAAPGDKSEARVEVLIQPEYMSKDNKRVRARQVWGDHAEGYSPDSDLVAVLMHLGYYAHNLPAPPASVVEVRALIRLLPPRPAYPAKARFLKSREWVCREQELKEGCSYQVERCWLVTRSAQFVDLAPCIDDLPAAQATVQPQFSDRQINTRHTGTARIKHSQDVSVQFNLCNEPWLKYSLAAIADKGMKPAQLTSARLLTSVLYLETRQERYQLALQAPAPPSEEAGKDLFSLSLCKTALPRGIMQKLGVPLPADEVEVVLEGVEWEEFKWTVDALHVRDQELSLRRLSFLPTTKPGEGVKAEEAKP